MNPANPIFTLPVTANYLGENSGSPYVQQYNFAVQRQISPEMNFQVAYVGNTSRKPYLQRDANFPVYIPGGSTASNVNSRRPYLPGTFGAIYETETAANTDYNSLQVDIHSPLCARFLRAGELHLLEIDGHPVRNDPTGPSSNSFVNANNLALDRAVSNLDIPHSFSLSWVWQAPQVKYACWIGKQVLSGWQLNGIMTARTGQAMNVTSGKDTNLDGNNNDRPDRIGDVALSGDRGRAEQIEEFFNTEAFVSAAELYGTSGRNPLYGPGAVNWDISAFKEFVLHENHHLQFRADFFNVFNEVNFGNPNGTLSSPKFGQITSAGSPRILQFGLKYLF